MPVRSIPRNYRSLTAKVNNARNRVAVAFESMLERDFYLLLDFDSTVASFEEQPPQPFCRVLDAKSPECLRNHCCS